MPTYDYLCDACGHRLEIYQGIKDDALTKCPKCKAKSLKRQFGSGGGILFKGTGFYQTDYRSDSYKAGEKSGEKSPEKAPEKSPEKPGEKSGT